ncbi:MAG: TadE/TadG family type IV pilus assembly protein [Candidatus Binataceae bacterium]
MDRAYGATKLNGWRRLRVARAHTGAQSSAEFAMVAVVFLILVFGTIDLSRALYAYNFVCYAARDAIRFAALNGSSSPNPAGTSDIQNLVMNLSNGLSATSQCPATAVTDLCATTAWTPDNNPGSTVTIQVNYVFGPLAPFLPTGALTLSSRAQLPIMR